MDDRVLFDAGLCLLLLLTPPALAQQQTEGHEHGNNHTAVTDTTVPGAVFLPSDGDPALLNVTYTSDVDPGGSGQRFPAVEVGVGVGVWVGECRSNVTEVWGLTGPVCSTRFTSFVLFVLVTAVLAVITLWTVLGNALVLCALYRYRALRTMSNCLIGNLAVSDLLLAITVLPVSATYDLLGYWVFGSIMCTVWLSIDVLYCTASIWGLCTIAFDRYTATVYPMWYHDKRSTKKALAYVVFVWVFSIVISLAPFIGWQDMISGFYIYQASINRHMCVLFSSQSYVIYSAVGSFLLPSFFMTFLYVKIFAVLHKQSDHLKRTSLTSGKTSPAVNGGCPTIAVSSIQDTSCAVLRDLTASTLMAEETTFALEEENEGEEGEDKADTISPMRSECDPDDSGVERNSNTSASSRQEEEEEEDGRGLLREQRSNSLNVEVGAFRTDTSLLSQPRQDLLAVSTCDIPMQFTLKKSRSAAFNLQGAGAANGTGGESNPLMPCTVPRSKSVSILSSGHIQQMDASHGAPSTLSLQRFALPWPHRRRNHMTTSMKRRFQLREQRATKRMLLIMACFFVCWIPFTLMYMLRSLCAHCKPVDDHVAAFIIWMGYVNSSLNPLLYTLFNDDFRKAFKKLLRIRCSTSTTVRRGR
ncbi:octopamine receptor 2-like [Babylonia areolata]|uniref:octopamine receptor 2-like n=1 Tax=Babylonia areolata TaxID=304850 RepID=UPI003FD4ACED